MTLKIRRKKWQDYAKDIFIEHPDWNAGQIYRELEARLGKENIPASITSVQKVLPGWKVKHAQESQKGLDGEWHLGTLDKHPLSPAGIARIIDYKLKAKKNNTDWVSIRIARWMDRLSSIYVSIEGQQIPLSADNLSFLATLYAAQEYGQEVFGEDYAFSPEFDNDTILKLLQEHPLEMTEENFNQWQDTENVKVTSNADGTANVYVRMTPEEKQDYDNLANLLQSRKLKQEKKGGKS